MKMSRHWAMPTHETFTCLPIKDFVERWLNGAKVIIDPFARNSKYGTITNDLNPDTSAEYHMTALDFLELLLSQNVKADVIIFDPPYSLEQVKQCYAGIGKKFLIKDAQNAGHWRCEKEAIKNLLKVNGIFLHFGWHSTGMGKGRETGIEEILLVCHGWAHNDTICIAERKIQHQEVMRLG